MPSSSSRHLQLLAATLVTLVCAVLMSIPSAAAASTDSCAGNATAVAAMTSTSQSACWQPFTSASPVNTELPSNPALASDNSAVQQHMSQYGWYFGDSATGFTFNESDGTRPVYFGTSSDPVMTIKCTNEEGPNTCQGTNGINVNGAQVHVPAGARPGSNWDAHMILVDNTTGEEYDLWHTTISGNTITSGTGSVTNVNTSNGTGSSGDAAGLALTAGLLRPSELASGHINHALVIDIPCTDATGANVGYSWPANGGWGEACGDYWNESPTGAPTIGQLFKLNLTTSQIANSGAPAWEQTIMTALATYGAYAEDTNGSWHSEGISIFSQDPTSFTSVGQADQWNTTINQLGGSNGVLSSSIPIPASELVTVNPCVPEETCPNASGPNPTPTTTTTTPTTNPTPVSTTPVSTATTPDPAPVSVKTPSSSTASRTGAGTSDATSATSSASAPTTSSTGEPTATTVAPTRSRPTHRADPRRARTRARARSRVDHTRTARSRARLHHVSLARRHHGARRS